MGQVNITVNGRNYRVACGDGEDERLLVLGAFVEGHVQALAEEFGQVGDDRLMMMSLLMIADELWEARAQIAALEKRRPVPKRAKSTKSATRVKKDKSASEPDPTCDLDELEAQLPSISPDYSS